MAALAKANRFLEIANRHSEMIPLLEEFVTEIKNLTDCDAVGVRILDHEGNIPYQAYLGFSQSFYELESPLSIESDQCMCTNVITGEVDPNLPFYTEGGSFYVNGTTRFLGVISEEEKGQTRNVCNQAGYETVALVPIRLANRILGLIHVADPRENVVPVEMVELLEGVGKQLGTAIQRVRVEEELRQLNGELVQLNCELALFNRASHAFSSSLDLDHVLATVLEEIRRLMDVTACSVWLIEPRSPSQGAGRSGGLVCRQATGPKSEIVRGWRLAPGEGLAGWVARSGESLIVPDARADERHFEDLDAQNELGLRSILSVPLRVKQDVIGVLQVVDTQVGRFDAGDLGLLEPLAASAAIAIKNARLYEQAQQEITERVRAEEEREQLLVQIQEQAQRVQQIVDTVPEGVLLLDAGLRVLSVNPAAREYLAVLSGAEVGDTLTRLGDCPLSKLLTSPPKGLWHEVEAKGPPRQLFEIIARPMESGPETEGWVLVIRDVTQKWETQRYVQQQYRLATVGQLAAGIAHDFNNIMATIVLYAQMLSRRPGLPSRNREQLITINQQAMHASHLIHQILDFSRSAPLEQQSLDLLPLLKEQVRLLERTLPENIKIDLAYYQDRYMVNADPTRMQQVLMNLALNARDAMPEGGTLHVRLERMRIEDRKKAPLPEMEAGAWVQLTVSDTGTGIPPDVLPHIFDPFFTTKPDGEGTGLGLAQVWGIVNQHEGHVDVNTEIGEGTTFTIYLPALKDSQLEILAQNKASTLPQGQSETILVVEDNATVRQAVMEGLESLNYRTLAAADGRQALGLFERYAGEIVLVVSDTVMPHMGGVALLHALRERGYKGQIIMLTGHPTNGRSDDLRSQGVVEWLQKPVSLERLAQTLAQALHA